MNEKVLADFDKAVVTVFNTGQLSQQPKYLVEIDCQDGEMLVHAYETVKSVTLRGNKLIEYPLEVIALITDPKKLDAIRKKLSHIPHRIAQISDTKSQTILNALKSIGVSDTESALYLLSSSTYSQPSHFQEYSKLKSHYGIINAFQSETPDKYLLDLASLYWFPSEGFCYRSLALFEQRPYIIRPATLDDFFIITQIEASNWPEDLRTPHSQIKEWIEKYPEGQLVIESQEGIEGVVYTQRIKEIEPLYHIQSTELHTLFDPKGIIFQLIAIFIKTEKQNSNMGGQLLEFVLHKATVTPHVTHVVGLTRCVNYPGSKVISMEDYLKQRNAEGELVDPVPRMHVQHGAVIKGLVPNYRPKDKENEGYGILIDYTLETRTQNKITPTSEKSKEIEITAEFIRTFVEDAIIDLLRHCGGLVEQDNSGLYSRTASLMDMGLDSLQLLELSGKISEQFNIELEPTFFFQYGTAEASIQYLIEKKLEVYKDWLYEVEWIPSTVPVPSNYVHDRLWVIFDEGTDLAARVRKKLEENYQYCVIIKPGLIFKKSSDNSFEVEPNSPKDFTRLFAGLSHLSQLAGVIYLWGYAIPSELTLKNIEAYHKMNCGGFVHLANALAPLNLPESSKLWIVNPSILTDGTNESLVQTPLNVLCKVAREEYPKSQCAHLALDPKLTAAENCEILCNELRIESHEPQIAWKEGKRLVSRIVPAQIESVRIPHFSSENSYLVMGGLRPLGLQLARWYIQRGAKTVILLDELEINSEIENEIHQLKSLGANVIPYVVNFDNKPILDLVFNQIKLQLPPIKGVIHSAGVADNELLMHMDWERFKPIYRLKLAGAWNLHLLTEHLNLDHFILFSTPLADIAPLGKANHSAGNSFMDALSYYRRKRGLPSLTIDWGPWELRFTVIKHMIDTSMSTRLKSIAIEDGLNALDHLFYLDKPQIIAAQIEWTTLITRWMKDNPILDEIARSIGLKQEDLIAKYRSTTPDHHLDIIESYLQNEVKKILVLSPRKTLDLDLPFSKLGLDQLQLTTLRNEIQNDIKEVASLPLNILEENPSLKQLSQSLKILLDKSTKGETKPQKEITNEPIAIIGIGCRYPGGADTPEKFWKIFKEGIDTITEVPPDRWDIDAYYDPDKNAPGKMYTRYGGFIDHVDLFDPQFFGISPREAEDMDPQQRISLEVTWEALENAGIPPSTLKGTKTGVFMGICFNDYAQLIVKSGDIDAVDNYYSTGNHYSVAAGRISYILGLEGPAMALDTACSSSLVSVNLAVEKLNNGQCDMAIAGGVNVILTPEPTINFCKSGMLAEDGRCKTFDESADGYVRSEGCGIVILKRLSDAERDHNRILAIIRATAVNQDGASTGLTVPNSAAQIKLIDSALKEANLQSKDIQFVEAHGTGTSLGDPIEVKAISATYGKNRQTPLIIGSAKTNIGHSEAAAGVAGLIKCILSLQNEEVPKHLHYHQLNSYIDFKGAPIEIPKETIAWPKGKIPRIAAVSSFGFSGTNSHVILEEGQKLEIKEEIPGPYLFPLSAKNQEALAEAKNRLKDFLKAHPDVRLSDVAYTLQVGREHFPNRLLFEANTREELLDQLAQPKKIDHPWLHGKNFIFDQTNQANLISLPTYPFQRERYWSRAAEKGQHIKRIEYVEVKTIEVSLWDQLIKGKKEEFLSTIKAFLRQTLVDLLKLKQLPNNFDQCEIFSLGMDSIMGIKFKNQVEESLNKFVSLPSTLIFDFPTIDKMSALVYEKILSLIHADHQETVSLPLIPISHTGIPHFKLSSAQKRMWFMYELNRQDTSFNIAVFARIKGEIILEELQKAFDAVVKRHAILRTTYGYFENEMTQVIQQHPSIPLKELDWRSFSESEQQQKIKELEFAKLPFDLERGPVIRPTFIWVSQDQAILHLEAHHIACDGTSFQKIFEDWISFYESRLSKTTPNLPFLKVEYVDYANWLLEEHQTLEYQAALHYWKEQLQNGPRMIQLPTDFPRQQIDPYQGAMYHFEVDLALRKKIEDFAKSHETTPFAVLLAVFATILHKYSRDEEINIGIPFSRRPLIETENMVGFFINTLVTRHTFGEDKSFTAQLKYTSQMVRDAFANQAASFEEVVDVLNIERNMAIHPLFQVHFNLLPGLFKNWKTPHVELEIIGANSGFPEFDLSLELFESELSYYAAMKYNAKIFTQDTIGRIVNHFMALLSEVMENPTLKQSEVSLLTPAERTLMLESWNATSKKYPLDKRAIDFFEEQVEKNPNKCAAIFGAARLSYQELNERANQLAHRLNGKPDQFIGICLPRSLDMLIALLAVMKSGAAYIPLDPSFPSHRLTYMVENSELNCLITLEPLLSLFLNFKGEAICLDREDLSQEPKTNPGKRSTTNNLAYVIYTSGSTGNPKGVQIEHKALINLLLSMKDVPGIKPEDLLLAVTTLSFDIAELELWLPLISGATVVIAHEEAKQDVTALQELIQKNQVTLMQATPTTWTMLFESGWPGNKNLTVLCGGEPLKPDLAQKITHTCKALWNMYGPTETTVWSSISKIEKEEKILTIGRPIANTTFYILDKNLHPTPLGVPGQLFIGGTGVARGYLKRPDLTAEKFISDPFLDDPKARIYNTGDLARYLRDGRVECLGRADYQVKIRGYRLELGDIESQLNQLKEVNNAVVIVREDQGVKSDKRLVAYIIPESKDKTLFKETEKQKTFFNEIKASLKKELPEYMIPAAFVLMQSFPLTPNRKIDRKGLPKPESIEQQITGKVAGYSNETEKQILEVWQEVIGTSSIGVDENFFDSGGNSLLAVQVFKRLNELFPNKIKLVDIFSYPTIQILAHYIAPDHVAITSHVDKAKERLSRFKRKIKGKNS